MTETIQEVIEIVDELNNVCFEHIGESMFSVNVSNDEFSIDLMGTTIHSSCNDEREIIDDEDYEPLKPYIIKQSCKHASMITKAMEPLVGKYSDI